MKPSLFSRIQRLALSLAVFGALSLLVVTSAQADQFTCSSDDTFPCGDVSDVVFSKAPSVFKFQARVSQAKLPIGKAVFSEVIVKVLEGGNLVCMEKFQEVTVRDSVLNLEIGHDMSCEFDELLAKSETALALQVCLGSSDSCLKPIEMASVPYAVKSSFSHRSSEATKSEEAAISHYTYRAAADRDLLGANGKLGTGYFDFVSFGTSTDGFLTWTPIKTKDIHKLTIAGRTVGGQEGNLTSLDTLTLDSTTTALTGSLTVSKDQTNEENLDVTKELRVSGKSTLQETDIQAAFTAMSVATFDQGLKVTTGDSHQVLDTSGLDVQGSIVSTGMISTQDSASIGMTLEVGGAVHLGDLVSMKSTLAGGAGAGALRLVSSPEGTTSLEVGPAPVGTSTQVEAVKVVQPLTAEMGVAVPSGAPVSTFAGEVLFTGNVRFETGNVYLTDAGQVFEHTGQADGDGGGGAAQNLGDWTFSGAHMQHAGQTVLQGQSDSPDLTALGALTVNGQVTATGLKVIGAPASFMTQATFSAEALFQDQVSLSDAQGANVMVLFQRGGTGEVHFAPSGVDTLKIHGATTFTGTGKTTVFNGDAQVDNELDVLKILRAHEEFSVGEGTNSWRVKPGASGLEYVANGEDGNYQTVVRVNGGTTVDINPDGATTGFMEGTRIYGLLTAHGETTFESEVTFRDTLSDVARFDATQARLYKPARMDAGLTVEVVDVAGDSHQALKVDENGVELGLGTLDTVTSVKGTFQANGSATFLQGISGSGALDVKGYACTDLEGFCAEGYFSTGSASDGSGGIMNRCCRVELK